MAKARRAYKDTTLQQLRSFCETARLGGMTAAAQELGLAQPTVWKQVRALERTMGVPLLEVRTKTCRLTPAGRMLAELAQPALITVVSLRQLLLEHLEKVPVRLTVAASPRILSVDLPGCIVAFERSNPKVELSLREVLNDEVAVEVARGAADLGFTPIKTHPGLEASIHVEWGYDLDPILLLPPDHPLGRKTRITFSNLRRLPVVNARNSFPDPRVADILSRNRLFDTQPRRVEAFYAAAIERYVQLGFGYGLVGHPRHSPFKDEPTKRNVSYLFGQSPVYAVTRAAAEIRPSERAFLAVVENHLRQK